MKSDIPFKVGQAARKFHRQRAAYYIYAASVLKGSGGNIKILQLFDNDVQRYQGSARGTLCEWWYDRYSENGGNLADSLQGTLPDDEVAVLRVAQDAGVDALVVALQDVGRTAVITDTARTAVLMTLLAAMIAVAIGIGMLTAFPVFASRVMRTNYDFLPLAFWGKSGKSFVAYAEWIESYIVYVAVAVGLSAFAINWTIPNLISPIREWLDEHIILYSVIRDLKGAMFLATMATLTRKRGGVMFTLKQSLETFSDSARTPWLKWRINQVIDGADETGALGVEAFNTGMISREMFYYLEDMQRARGFADGFEETGKYVESTVLEQIMRRLNIYRWVLLILALLAGLAMFSWQFRVIYEMKGAMATYLASPH